MALMKTIKMFQVDGNMGGILFSLNLSNYSMMVCTLTRAAPAV
jgi:hypothetical protein